MSTATAVVSTAIVPFKPTSVTEALQLADKLAASHLLPAALQKQPSDVLVVLLAGYELGLSPMQSLRGIYVIEGKASTSADTMVALVRRSGVCEYFRCVESNERRAVYEAKRKGEPATRLEWTLEMAKRANLLVEKKPNWMHYPNAMLRARCKADLCRAVFEDVVQGIVSQEEVTDGVLDATAESRDLPIVIADKTVEEWQREASMLGESIAQAPDVATLEALLPDIRVLPDDLRQELRNAYAQRFDALQPSTSKTDKIKEKLRARGGNAEAPKTTTVEDDKSNKLHPLDEKLAPTT